jgi:osmotically-inducible protein OsmY
MGSSEHSDRGSDQLETTTARQARDRLAQSPYAVLGRVAISYHRGALMLRGCLPSDDLKQVAQELVSRGDGVKAVVNEIEVRLVADRGPSGTVVPRHEPDAHAAPNGRGRGDSTRGG